MSETKLHTDAYPLERAKRYARHHDKSGRTRLTTWRERRIVEAALKHAGAPALVLDLPCGTGRFWPAFAKCGVERVVAADNSDGMLAVAGAEVQTAMAVRLLKTSAFEIELPDGTVPFVASLRFVHHLARREDRLRALREFGRVSSRYVLVSLWTDGNLQAWRRGRNPDKREQAVGYGRRICLSRDALMEEFAEAGFTVRHRWRVWPCLSMWTFYLLERRDAR